MGAGHDKSKHSFDSNTQAVTASEMDTVALAPFYSIWNFCPVPRSPIGTFCLQKCNLDFIRRIRLIQYKYFSSCRPSQFYLVLDVTNLTAQEMLLNYTFNKNIVIEARESCRVPVPVERCSLFDCAEEPERLPNRKFLITFPTFFEKSPELGAVFSARPQ